MANNGIYYSSGHSLSFTTSGTTWLSLNSQGLLSGLNLSMSAVTASTISETKYIDFNTGTTNPSQTGGRIFFDNTSKALSYYDIANNLVPIAMGQQLYTRVYNNTGSQIDKGKVVAITGTSNSLPSVILAVNTHTITSARPIGLTAENIPSGSEGLVLNNGILSGITLNTFANGDTLYLSDTVPGGYISSTSSLAFTARTNEIGYVLQTGTTTGKIYVNINNEDSNLSLTDIERNILEGNVISSGTYEFTGMTRVSNTLFSVAPLKGWIVNNTNSYATLPDVINVIYSGTTGTTTPYINSDDQTYVLITSASTLSLQNTFPTPQQRRENIFLGRIVHPVRGTIQNVNNTIDFDVSPMAAIRDLWTPLKLINQGVIPSANGANLSINTSAGALWGNGIGWATNQLNPDSVSISGTSPTTFQYRTRNGVITGGTGPYTGNTTFVDPANYDLNGVVTAVGGGSNSSTNQRIYLFTSGLIRIQYGQQVYSSLAAAVAGSQTEQFVEYSNNRDNGILIGILSVNKNATNLSSTSQAVFNFISKFGEVLGGTGGLSTTTLQQAYDNSTTPEITINSTLDGLSIKNGTGNADNVTNLLEGLNSGGTTTSFIRADGAFSGTSVFATTISATTYDNLPGSSSSNCQTTFYVTNISGCSPVNMLTEVNMLSGLTVTGAGYFTGEITASTISATTYQNYPTNFTSGLTATTISATTYENLPQSVSGTGTTNYVPKWNDSTGIGDSQIYDDGSVVSIVGTLSATTYSNVPVVTGGTYTSGTLSFNNATGGTFNITGLPVGGQGGQVYYFNTSVSQSPYKEFGPTGTSVSQQSVSITIDSGDTLTLQSYLTPSGYPNSLIIPGGIWSFYLHTYKEDSLSSFDVYCDVYLRTSGGVETYLFSTDPFDVTSIDPTPSMGITDGYFSGKTISTSDRILILVRATNTGDSSKRIWFVTEGTEHYSYGITTFNGIPGNVTSLTTGTGLSGDATTGAITIINTDKGSSQNIFKNIQVAGVTQFSAGSNSSNLNFSGINLTITSAATNTLVFSAGTSSGTVTSVTLATGTSGTDVNVSNPTITTSGTITLNIPDASDTNRGLITTTNQKLKGIKEFVSGITLSNLTASQILALDSLNIVQSLSTATYPSLTELSYVKGVTSAIQTQLNNRVATSGGTINGNLTVTGTTTSATISATTYQNLPVSAATNGTGISTSTSNGVVTITNTGVTSITASSGLSGNSTTGAITLINTQVQGITGVTAGTGISATTTNNVTTITNTQVQGITGVTAGTGISATTTNNVATITNTQVQGITGVTGTSPISAITTNNVTTVSIPDASADGSTKGAATFTAADFNSTSGVISLDYTNGQKASASQPGFLSAANWSTFNNAVFVIRCNISNVSPADGVTYYFNDSSISLSTSATIYRTVIPYACTLIGASIVMQNNATTASNEASTINFRLNNSTDTLLTSGATLGGAPIVVNVYSATSLSTSIAAGDTFNIKWTNPTYVTNPTSAVVVVELFFQRT